MEDSSSKDALKEILVICFTEVIQKLVKFWNSKIILAEEVFIKFEKTKTSHPQLLYESKVYRALKGGDGISKLIWFGIENQYNILVTESLGKSLETHFNDFNQNFSEMTLLYCAKQMIERLEYIHETHFIHRDIKPSVFFTGKGPNSKTIYLTSFGPAKRYRHPKTKKHVIYREGKKIVATAQYASINNHFGAQESRRDDMESLGYVLAYLSIDGKLPWQEIKERTEEDTLEMIKQKKMATIVKNICDKEYVQKFIEYSRSLRYEDKPNYSYLKSLFVDKMSELYGNETYFPEWVEQKDHSAKLKKIIEILETFGKENDEYQPVLNETTLKSMLKINDYIFKEVVDYGIKVGCIKKETVEGKFVIILIDDEIDEEKDKHEDIKRMGTNMFKIIKESGYENENEEAVCREGIIKRELAVSEEEYNKCLKFCLDQGCLRTYQSKNKTYIVLLRESFKKVTKKDVEELKDKVIEAIKEVKKETVEGYMFMTVESLLEVVKIKKGKLRKVVKHGLKDDLLKFDVVKNVKIVVYTQERRLKVSQLI